MIDQTYCWKGFGNWDSHCRLRIFRPHPESIVVVVGDPGGDSGTTITNGAGELATRIISQFRLDPKLLIWIEHIPTSSVEFSRVEFDWLNGAASHPRWSYLTRLEAEAIAQAAIKSPAASSSLQHRPLSFIAAYSSLKGSNNLCRIVRS